MELVRRDQGVLDTTYNTNWWCRDCPVPGCVFRIGNTDDGLSTLAYVGLF